MRFILYSLVIGFLVVWGVENVPNFMGYLFVGTIVILLLRLINKK